MPVKGQNIDALGVFLSYISKQREQQYRCYGYEAYRDVEGRQTDKRIVGCSEQFGLDRETFVADQVSPLTSRGGEKKRSKRERQKPPQRQGANVFVLQRFHTPMN